MTGRLIIQGVDPGVVDTGVVSLILDSDKRVFEVLHRVYSGVSSMDKNEFVLKAPFIKDLGPYVSTIGNKKDRRACFIEGYRNRGKDMRQDQQMTSLVQMCHQLIPGSKVVDNTGVKKVVKPAFMDLFAFDFPKTNHADLHSAARIALKGGLMNPEINRVLSDFVRDAIEGRPWTRS